MALKKHLIKNKKFLKDNFVLFSGIFILNVFGFLFQFYAGRKLGPGDYGVFGSLLSLIYIIAMPLNSIQTVITKYVSTFKAKEEIGKISYLLSRSLRKMSFIGVGILIVFLLLTPLIARFLKIDNLTPIYILGGFLLLSLVLPIVRGVLQGLQKFTLLGISFITEGVFKLGAGVLLVFLGFGVSGAIGGFTLSYVFAFVLTLFFLARYFGFDKEKFDTGEIYKYSFPVFMMLVSLTGIYTIDLLLVKHFFDSVDAGHYAALSLLGKIIFFGTWSVSMVMFSKVAEDFAAGKNTKKTLYKSLFLVGLFGFGVTVFYFLFPEFVINILFGNEYFAIKPLLGFFAIFMTLFSLVYIIAFYHASVKRVRFIYFLILFNLVEILLIWFNHNSLEQVVMLLLWMVWVLFISLMFYTFLKDERPFNSDSSIQ
jgi:O-antigen/teichoic acid export membrane protein